MEGSGGSVEGFFDRLTAQDWDGLAALLAAEVVRIGPFGDLVVGRARYLHLLRESVPSDYRNDVHRITYARDGRSAFARVTEHLHYEDQELHLEEAYSFLVDDEGLLSRVEVFWQTPQLLPGAQTGSS
jgi:hypothetical protein